ncbi:MAG: hypothetical protein PVH88_26325 [Ignavibacteria bacterium]|jgi:hypothetical protein
MINIYEIIGYAASLLVAVSLSMKNILQLRWLNLAGAVLFSVYGIVIKAYPVFAVNAYIVIINIYYLRNIYNRNDKFDLHFAKDGSRMLKKFVNFHKEDLLKFYPGFDFEFIGNRKKYLIFRNLVPAGLFIYHKEKENEFFIDLDYAIPDFRDLQNGKFVYSELTKVLKDEGCTTLNTKSINPSHKKYLKKIGFVLNKINENIFEKVI